MQFGSILVGLMGRIGIMMSIPFLVFTPPELADDFADRMDSWVDDHISRMDALEAELDRLEAWRQRHEGA